MKTPQPLDSRKIHIPINRSDKFESPFVNLEVFHGILPLSRTDSFYGITKEVLFPYYSGYNVIFIGILLPRHRLAGHLLDDAFCFLTAGGQSSACVFCMWTALRLWCLESFILPSLVGRIIFYLESEIKTNHPLAETDFRTFPL